MRKGILLFVNTILYLLLSQRGIAQNAKEFQKDFETLAESGFDSAKANHLLDTYFTLLTPFNQINQFAEYIKGEKPIRFPLIEIKEQLVYRQQIEGMLESAMPQVRLLGYLMIASGGDNDKVGLLAGKLKTEPDSNCSLWLGMGLMSLGYKNTSSLFPWVVKRNVEAGGFLYPMFVSLSADSLQKTAYEYIDSNDWNERIYAIQLFINTKKSIRTDTLLRRAITTWPWQLKGYAIVPAQSLQIGELLPLLTPLLDSSSTKRIALEALAGSPTNSDRQFVSKLMEKDSLDKDVMDALLASRHMDMAKLWLESLQSGKLPSDYYFLLRKDTLLKSDALLPNVQETLRMIKDTRSASHLMPVLQGRQDAASQDILIGSLRHQDGWVRETAATTLLGICSDKLKLALPEIISDKALYTAALFDLLIACEIDSLQDTAEHICRTSSDSFVSQGALNYLASFPEKRHLKLFRKVIKDREGEYRPINRIAATGLANLKDLSSVPDIIEVSEEERKNSDLNSMVYIRALGKMKTQTSKNYISTFLTGEDAQVRELASKILQSW
ncbi:MAG TPA: hypothetical protein VGN64_10390 [Dyadobacter sp.]|nr:hypothetical protein [Dyadobacter sp.]